MGRQIKTIVQVKRMFEYDYESLEDAYNSLGKEMFIDHIYNTVKQEQEEYLSGIVGYLTDCCQVDAVAGIASPYEIIQTAREWNKCIYQNAAKYLDELMDYKKTIHVSDTASFIQQLEEAGDDRMTGYSSVRYCLKKALEELDDSFVYDNYRLVMTEGNYGSYCYTTKLSPQVLRDIETHPEEYAIIYTNYK